MINRDYSGISVEGHLKISSPDTGEVFINKRNAIHYENISISLAECLSNVNNGFIYEMNFGNGGTLIDPTGVITYLTPNTTGSNAALYNQTFTKVVDPNSVTNTDPTRNSVSVRHATGTNYTDIYITCFLDYDEPNSQDAFDNTTNNKSSFVFDELGIRAFSNDAPPGRLLTHVIFHPIQKSANRLLLVEYTIRIQSLTGLNEVS